jgi:tetratricopeptide (TPR) repeat protein
MYMKKIFHVILTAAVILTVSCVPNSRPADTGPAASMQEQGPAAAGAAPTPKPLVSIADAVQSLKFEKQGDKVYAQLARTRDMGRALELAGSAIELYKKSIDLNKGRETLVHKYCIAIELKYNLIIPDGEQNAEKQKIYAETLAMLEQLYAGGIYSKYAEYDTALLLILNAQYYIIFQVIGAVDRIHGLCEAVYKDDKSFENYSAAAALGRINFLAPNIPFILSWPDKNLSRQFLEEAHRSNPDSHLIKFFLADTLYALDEKEKAAGYFRDVMKTEPRQDIYYFQDRKVQRNCGIRMKELGLQ